MPAQVEKSGKDILNDLRIGFEDEEKKVPIEVREEPELQETEKSLLQKVEEEAYLQKPITDDGGQPLVSPPAPQQPIITLPMTQSTYNTGMKSKVSDSVRWLAEWCWRLVKILGTQAVFREEKNE